MCSGIYGLLGGSGGLGKKVTDGLTGVTIWIIGVMQLLSSYP